MERTKICDAMVFAIDNADSAFEARLTLSEKKKRNTRKQPELKGIEMFAPYPAVMLCLI